MNNVRRKAIEEIRDKLAEIADAIDEIYVEEEEYRDNMPENLQSSERYEIAENAIANLEEASQNISDALDYLESAAE